MARQKWTAAGECASRFPQRSPWFPLAAFCLFGLFGRPLIFSPEARATIRQETAERPASKVEAESTSGNSKALKYHSALRRRPTPGYLYDRFYLAWLETSSIDQLEEFLVRQAEDNPSHGDRLLLAFFYEKQGREVDSLKQFRLALAEDPGNAETLLEKAKVEARTLDFETALSDLSQAAASDPKSEVAIEIAQLHAKLLLRSRQTEAATKVLGDLLSRFGDDQRLVEDVVELQVEEGQYESALSTLEDLIGKTTDPYQKVMRQLRQGDVLQLSGKREEALSQYAATLSQSGRESWLEREILAQIEQLFVREDNIEGLVTFYEGLLEKEPQRLALNKAVSGLKLQLGDVDGALEQFGRVVEMTPGDRSNREAYIDLLVKADRLDSAVEQLKSLLQQQGDAELNLKLAELQKQTGAEGSVVESTLREYLRASGETEFAYQRAARQATSLELIDLSVSLHRENVERHPDSLTARENLASVLYEQEKKEEALGIWRELAGAGDANQLARVGRILSTRREHQAAYDLLVSQQELVNENAGLLNLLCRESIALKQYTPAVEWVLRLVELSETSSDLDGSLVLALQVIDKADQLKSLSGELADKSDRTVNQTCLLSELYEQQGDPLRANRLLSERVSVAEAANDLPTLQKLAMQQVRLLSSRQNWEEASKIQERLTQLPGGMNVAQWQKMVELYRESGQLEKALSAVDDWKKVARSSAAPWMTEAEIFLELRREQEAMSVLQSVLHKFPEDERVPVQLTELYLRSGKYREAKQLAWVRYEESEQLGRKLQWAQRLAEAASRAGTLDEVARELRSRKRKNPQALAPILALVHVYRFSGDRLRQQASLQDAARLEPENIGLLQELARLEAEQGEWEAALETLQRAIKIQPSADLHHQLAKIQLEFGEFDAGYRQLLRAVGGTQADPRDFEGVIASLMQWHEWELALRLTEEYIGKLEETPDYRLRYLLAVLQVENQQFEAAASNFADLTFVRAEISGLKPLPATYQTNDIQAGTPTDVLELLQVIRLNNRMHSYRGQSSILFSSAKQNHRSLVWLPENAAACRRLAIYSLLSLSKELEEEQRELITRSLDSGGHVLFRDLFDSRIAIFQFMESLPKLCEDYPDNFGFLGMAVLYGDDLGRQSPFACEKICERVLEVFPASEIRIRLLSLATLCFVNPEKHSSRFEEFLQQHGTDSDPIYADALLEICQKNYVQYLPENSRKKVCEQIAERAQEIVQRRPDQLHSVSLITVCEDGEKWVEMLNAYSQQESSVQRRSVRQNPSVINLPTCPPRYWSSFRQNLASTITQASRNIRSEPFGDTERNVDAYWLERIAPHVDLVQSPVLKVFLKLKTEESRIHVADRSASFDWPKLYQNSKTFLNAELTGQRDDVDLYLLLAGLACQAKCWEDSRDALENARALPMSPEIRSDIDGCLVSIGLQAIGKSSESTKVIESARAAAIRLKRSPWIGRSQNKLVNALVVLGLKEEAEKLTGGQPSRSAATPNPFAVPRPKTDMNKIRGFAASDKEDAAVRLLNQKIDEFSRNYLSSQYVSEEQLGLLRVQVASLGLEDGLLQEATRHGISSTRERLRSGIASDLWGEPQDAIDSFRNAYHAEPRNQAILCKLLSLLMVHQPEQLVEVLQTVPEDDWEKLFRRMNDLGYTRYVAQTSVFSEAIQKCVESYEESNNVDGVFYWLTHLGQGLAFDEGGQIASSNAAQVDWEQDLQELIDSSETGTLHRQYLQQAIKMDQEKHAARAKLYLELLRFPEASGQAFLGMRLSPGSFASMSDAEWESIAENVLRSTSTSTELVESLSEFAQFAGVANFGNDHRVLPYFLGRLYSNDHWSRGEKLEQQLQEVGKLELAQAMQRRRQMYQVEEDQFTELAVRQFGKAESVDEKIYSVCCSLKIWNQRSLTCSLEDLVEAAFDLQDKCSTSNVALGATRCYLSGLCERGQVSEMVAFLNRLTVKHCGVDLAEWRMQNKPAAGLVQQRRQNDIRQLIEFFFYSDSGKDCRDEILKLARNPEPILRRCYELANDKELSADENAELLIDLLESTGYLGELNTMLPIQPPSSGVNHLLTQLRFQLVTPQQGQTGRLTHETLIGVLANREENFGTRLLVAGLEDDSAGLLAAVGNEERNFQTLPADQKQILIQLISDFGGEWLQLNQSYSGKAEIGRQLIRESVNQYRKELVEEYLAEPVEAKPNYSRRQQAYELIMMAAELSSEDEFVEVVRSSFQLDAMANQPFRTRQLHYKQQVNQFLGRTSFERIELYLQLATMDEFADDSWLYANSVQQTALFLQRQLFRQDAVHPHSVTSWQTLLSKMQERGWFAKPTGWLLASFLERTLLSAELAELVELANWSGQRLAEAPEDRTWQVFNYAVESRLQAAIWWAGLGHGHFFQNVPLGPFRKDNPPCLQHLLVILRDEGLPLDMRWGLACQTLRCFENLTEEMTRECLKLFVRSLDRSDEYEGWVGLVAIERARQLGEIDSRDTLVLEFADGIVDNLNNGMKNYFHSSGGLLSLLQLLDRVDEESSLQRLFSSMPPPSLGLEAQVELMKLGYFEREAEFPPISHQQLGQWLLLEAHTPILDQRLSELPDDKVAAEDLFLKQLCYAALKNDRRVAGAEVASSPEQRLGKLLEPFSQLDFQSEEKRIFAATVFAMRGVFDTVILEVLREATDHAPIDRLGLMTVDQFQPAIQNGANRAMAEFCVGDPEFFVAYLQHLTELRRLSGRAKQVLAELFGVHGRTMVSQFHRLSREQQTTVLRTLDFPEYSEYRALSLALHLIANQEEHFFAKYAGVRNGGFNADDVWSYLATAAQQVEPERRRHWVVETWRFTAGVGGRMGQHHFWSGNPEVCPECHRKPMGLRAILAARLVSEETLLEIGPDMAEMYSADGEIWRQLGQLQMQAGHQQQAMRSCQMAIELVTDKMKQARANRVLEYAYLQYQAGDRTEAKKAIQDVSPVLLLGENVDRFDEIMNSPTQ